MTGATRNLFDTISDIATILLQHGDKGEKLTRELLEYLDESERTDLLIPSLFELGELRKKLAVMEEEPYILSEPLEKLKLTARTLNILKSEDMCLIGDLAKNHVHNVLRIPNIGKKSLREIQAALANYDLGFSTNVDD